jgi:hypothetical protein
VKTLRNTYNTPDVFNEMVSVDGVQPHSDPIRCRQSFSCLVVHTVSIRMEVLAADMN